MDEKNENGLSQHEMIHKLASSPSQSKTDVGHSGVSGTEASKPATSSSQSGDGGHVDIDYLTMYAEHLEREATKEAVEVINKTERIMIEKARQAGVEFDVTSWRERCIRELQTTPRREWSRLEWEWEVRAREWEPPTITEEPEENNHDFKVSVWIGIFTLAFVIAVVLIAIWMAK